MIDCAVETHALADETRVVSVAGELDMYTAPPFKHQIFDALSRHARVVVDFSACEFLDSTALGILTTANKRLAGHEHRLVLVAADRNIVKLFQITGLDSTFTIVPTRASALTERLVSDWRDEEARARGDRILKETDPRALSPVS